MSKSLKKILLTIISGILLGLSYPSFPEIPTGILAWFAFVPLLLATREETNFRTYFWQTFSIFLISGPLNFWWTALFSWKAFAVCYTTQTWGVYLPFLLHFFLQKRFGWQRALFLLPFHWTFLDWINHQLPHTLQVNNIAYTQANNIWLIQFTDITGMWGVTFWVVMMNILITFLLAHKRFEIKKVVAISAWLSIVLGYSFWNMKLSPKNAIGTDNETTKVSIIQTRSEERRVGKECSS